MPPLHSYLFTLTGERLMSKIGRSQKELSQGQGNLLGDSTAVLESLRHDP